MIFAIDPGTRESGWVQFEEASGRVLSAGVSSNESVLQSIRQMPRCHLAIEKIEAMGMAVGAEVFETVHWSGRFFEAWPWWIDRPVHRVTRRAVKLHLCGTMKAKDPNIRQALIDRLGAPGTKKNPGGTYGVTSHAWPALAVAIVVADGLAMREDLARPMVRQAPQAALVEEAGA